MDTPPRNQAEYMLWKLCKEIAPAPQQVLADATVSELFDVLRLHQEGLLTSGDVLWKFAVIMEQWADKSEGI